MTQPITLSVQSVTVSYGRHIAVDQLSFVTRPGEIYGLLGPNGSGKSSTLSAIAGALTPASGTVEVAGIARTSQPAEYRRRLGVVPQELALYEELTVRDNLSFFGRLYGIRGKELKKRAEEAITFTQLAEQADQTVHTLSGGMQRRVNLGCALLHRPALLLLDEPTVGLDLESRNVIFDNLRKLRAQGISMVLTTHHLDEAEQLCDRIGILDRGKMVAEGSLEELRKQIPAQVLSQRAKVSVPRWERPRLEEVLQDLIHA